MKEKSKKIRYKNINQDIIDILTVLIIFCHFLHLQDTFTGCNTRLWIVFSHTVFRLTFKGTSIAQARKLIVWLLLALITPLPLPHIVSTVL